MMFLLKCPKCGNNMKYDSRGVILTKKRKRCVYCGRSFKAGDCIVKKL